MALLIRTDNTVDVVKPENGKDFKAVELYRLIECDTFEVVYPQGANSEGLIMVIDEEGKLVGKRLNLMATAIFGVGYDVIVGNALLCNDGEIL